jgi:DNA relaxase NicK
MVEGENWLKVSVIPYERLAASVDWVTVTARSGENASALFAAALMAKDHLLAERERLHRWSFQGYHGWKIGPFSFGSRDDGCIAIASSWGADYLWDSLGKNCDNCSRIDLAVTVLLRDPHPEIPETYYNWFTQSGPPAGFPKLGLSLIKNTNGGQTLYVGSRVTDQFARVYDKAAEQNETELIGRLWRYEVEYKNRRAKGILKALLNRCGETVPSTIAGMVWNWYDAREVPPVWACGYDVIEADVEARVSSDDVSLKWITTQVAPTISRLADNGRLEDVVIALGLQRYGGFKPHDYSTLDPVE